MSSTRFFLLAVVLAAVACGGPRFQRIRLDVPVGAVLRIPAGYGTKEVVAPVPFVGNFEIGSVEAKGGIPVIFELDANAAKRLDADRPLKIYGRLSIGKQTEISETQTLRLAPSEASLSSLVRGEVSQIFATVTDPNAGNVPVAVITLRMAPF